MLYIKSLYGNNIIKQNSPDKCKQKYKSAIMTFGEERKKQITNGVV